MTYRPEREPDRTRLDLNPADMPEPLLPGQPLVEAEVEDRVARRERVVRRVCAAINLICGVFAVVLAVHVFLVLAGANPNNGFASFVDGWSSGISLGLRGLFTPADAKFGVLLNDGLAAIGWLLIALALTYLIRQFALPGPRRAGRYRRYVIE